MKKGIGFVLIVFALAIAIGYVVNVLFPQEIVTTTVEYKTRIVTKSVYLDAPPKIRGVVYPPDTMEIPADTAELIARYRKLWYAYYTRNMYKDTLTFDTLGYAVLNQQVVMNSIDSMNYQWFINSYEKTITNNIVTKHNFYIGLEGGKLNLSPVIKYNNSNRYDVFVRYNVLKGEVHGGVLINIKEMNKLW